MKRLKLLVECVADVARDLQPVFIGLIALIIVAGVVDRILFAYTNTERVVDVQYGVVQWPGPHPLVKMWYNRDYDGRGTKKAAVIDMRWPLHGSTHWFIRPDGATEICTRGLLGRNCRPLAGLPAIARGIMQSGENRLATLTN